MKVKTMYLMIFEDGSKRKTTKFSNEDREAVDAGVLEVIDVSDAENPKEFYEGTWHAITEVW